MGKKRSNTKVEESTGNVFADLGLPDDPGTKALFDFVDEALKK